MNIVDIQNEIVEEFTALDDWMDRYALIIEMGNDLAPFPEEQKTPQNMIEGCQSRVWITVEEQEGLLVFSGDSDAIIVRGIVALLLKVLNNQSPQTILETPLFFIEQIGLQEHLSPTRSNGLVAMIRQIRLFATTYLNRTGTTL